MGGFMTKIVLQPQNITYNLKALIGLKRRRDATNDGYSETDSILHTPKRKKLTSTVQYIYQALFKEGKNSDVTIIALEKHWRLHKLYLSQSPYFACMFSGSWREANEETVRIEIVDPKINFDALYRVFGSLYLDEITLEPADVVPTLATATLFHLEGIINQCAEIMMETINVETVTKYYDAACDYGVSKVKEATFKWLLINLLSDFQEPKRLLEIRSELLEKLVSNPDLFVLENEFSLYALLRFWLFLQFHPAWRPLAKYSQSTMKQFFQSREDKEEFLSAEEGKPFAGPFQALRFQHLVNHFKVIGMLKSDRIVPISWITSAVTQRWCSLLRIDYGLDRGPRVLANEEFSRDAIRCGRILVTAGEHEWSWTGFNMGLDLIWSCDSRTLKAKRNDRAEHHEIILRAHPKRHFMCRVTLISLNEQKQVKLTQTSGLKTVTLSKNEETVLLAMDQHLTYPLLLSVNLIVNTPLKEEHIQDHQ